MKRSFSLAVAQPCSEKWESFVPTEKGGFCGSCNKVVVDFTRMGNSEVLEFFKNKDTRTCGRFRPDQLKAYPESVFPKINPGLTLLKAGFIGLLLVLISKQASAQIDTTKVTTEIVQYSNHAIIGDTTRLPGVVRGVVKDEYGDPVAGANVLLKGTTIGTATDADGRFELPQELNSGDVLQFSFIGLLSKEFVVPKGIKDNTEIPVLMMCMRMEVTGEVAVAEIYETPSGFQKLWEKVKGIF